MAESLQIINKLPVHTRFPFELPILDSNDLQIDLKLQKEDIKNHQEHKLSKSKNNTYKMYKFNS